MADVFDISSSKKSRSTYESTSGNFNVQISKMRRDPRLKSPVRLEIDDKRSQEIRQRQEDQKQQQDLWNAQSQADYSRQVQPPSQYPSSQMISTFTDQQRQQFNANFPPQMVPNPSAGYPTYRTGEITQSSTIQPPYQQYQQQPFYPQLGSDGSNYIQAPPPPSWQSSSASQEFRDIPRAPPPPRMHLTPPPPPDTKKDTKKEAIVQEMKQQLGTLLKQREEYNQKRKLLQRELDGLNSQKAEILRDSDQASLSRDVQRILKENNGLQVEIKTRLEAVSNVIEMLTSVIDAQSEEKKIPEKKAKLLSQIQQNLLNDASKPVYNYVHYDPELHWCRICDVFPVSAKDYLLHLLTDQHKETTKQHQLVDMPWHNTPPELELPTNPDGPVKRTPIKGIQFFVPASAWFCKLCDKWIGDLHCASAHLKSQNHIQNFTNFVEQNPHWETDWISDREKAFSRQKNKPPEQVTSNALDSLPTSTDIKKRKKNGKEKRDSSNSSRDKKRKKKSKKRRKSSSDSSSSSSSSDDSSSSDEDMDDKTRSIRVAMRNKMKMQAQMLLSEEFGEKLNVLTKLVEDGSNRKRLDSKAASKDLLNFQAFNNRVKNKQESDSSKSKSWRSSSDRKYEDDRRRSPVSSRSRRRYDSPPRKYDRRSSPSRKKDHERSPTFDFSKRKNEPPKYPIKFEDRKKVEIKREDSKKTPPKESEEKLKFPIQKKLPLIGRMPLFKKKTEHDEKKSSKNSKFSDNNSTLPAPGLVHVSQLSGPSIKFNAENPPPPPQIIPDPPMIMPDPPHISGYMCYPPETHLIEPAEEAQMLGCLPPQIMMAPAPQQRETPKGGLPPDLQDALNIIFPGDRSKEDIEREVAQRQQQQEALMMAAQFGSIVENYSSYSTYDGYNMQMIAPPIPPVIPETPARELRMVHHHIPHPSMNDKNPVERDDLAMLGIDAEDLAAQNM